MGMNDGSFYDPKEVRVIVNGLDITGFADGESISVEPVTKELFKHSAGLVGDVAFAKVHDDRHTVTLTLKASSPSNAVLDALAKTPTSFATAIRNTSVGKYLGGGSGCRIIERPTDKFGAEERKIEWKILVPKYSSVRPPED